MFSVVKSFSAAERLDLASQIVRSFPAGTEFLLIGAAGNDVERVFADSACEETGFGYASDWLPLANAACSQQSEQMR